MKHKLIYVEWEDAYSREGWQTGHELDLWAEQKFVVQQSGFVYAENKDYMILAGGLNPGDEYGEIQYKQTIKVPKSWISARVDITKYVEVCLSLNKKQRKKLDEIIKKYIK